MARPVTLLRLMTGILVVMSGACSKPVVRQTDLPAPSARWRMDSIRVRRADAPRNPCRTLEDYRDRFFAKVPGAKHCSELLDQFVGWKLHYRLVRTRTPALQFESIDGEGVEPELKECFEKGPLRMIPMPAEIAVLSEVSNDGYWSRLECHRVGINLSQDEFLEAKMRTPLMKVGLDSKVESAEGQPWLFRLWMAPYVDPRGVGEGWLKSSLLPSGSCQLCLKKAWRDHEKARP